MESEWLDKHLMKCKKCREDFIAYEAIVNAILEENANTNINLAPSDLETTIMKQISEMSLAKKDDAISKNETRLQVTFVLNFVIIMMIVFVIMMRQDAIARLQTAIQMSFMARFGAALEGARLSIDSFITSVYSLSATFDTLFERAYFAILLAALVLAFIQFTLWKKTKQHNEGE